MWREQCFDDGIESVEAVEHGCIEWWNERRERDRCDDAVERPADERHR
jgi:hypothetical protein